jgi:phosphoglycerol transferase MdoB-like AlkP superfamily enzyme
VPEYAREESLNSFFLHESIYSVCSMQNIYAFDDPRAPLITKASLFKTADERLKRNRITRSELATNFMLCQFCFFIQFSYIYYIFLSLLSAEFVVGDLQLNITRLISAIAIHAILIPESD